MLYNFVLTLIVAFSILQVAAFCTTIHLHRSATHKALVLHPVVEWMMKLMLWLTTGQCTKEWVAVHRKHHQYTDKEGDPHSPKIEGFWHVQLGNVFYYVREIKKTDVVVRYASDIKEGWWDHHVWNRGLLGIGVGIVILCLIAGPVIGLWWALAAAGIHTVLYVFVLTSSINGLCHTKGYRNFDNTATNIRLLALLTGGEGLHNNHHGYPRSPKFSWKVSEFDPAWPLIKLLILMRLARPSRTIAEITG